VAILPTGSHLGRHEEADGWTAYFHPFGSTLGEVEQEMTGEHWEDRVLVGTTPIRRRFRLYIHDHNDRPIEPGKQVSPTVIRVHHSAAPSFSVTAHSRGASLLRDDSLPPCRRSFVSDEFGVPLFVDVSGLEIDQLSTTRCGLPLATARATKHFHPCTRLLRADVTTGERVSFQPLLEPDEAARHFEGINKGMPRSDSVLLKTTKPSKWRDIGCRKSVSRPLSP
jgi:hypothetical protein